MQCTRRIKPPKASDEKDLLQKYSQNDKKLISRSTLIQQSQQSLQKRGLVDLVLSILITWYQS